MFQCLKPGPPFHQGYLPTSGSFWFCRKALYDKAKYILRICKRNRRISTSMMDKRFLSVSSSSGSPWSWSPLLCGQASSEPSRAWTSLWTSSFSLPLFENLGMEKCRSNSEKLGWECWEYISYGTGVITWHHNAFLTFPPNHGLQQKIFFFLSEREKNTVTMTTQRPNNIRWTFRF